MTKPVSPQDSANFRVLPVIDNTGEVGYIEAIDTSTSNAPDPPIKPLRVGTHWNGAPIATGNAITVIGGKDGSGNAAPANLDAAGNLLIGVGPTSVGTPTSVSGSATDVVILASNALRRGATVYNDSSAILSLALGFISSATAFTVKIAASGYYEIPFGFTGEIRGLWASATGDARITEVTA